jgi:catechol 2,3-dioxygenase-like lactoylglutathione lyase family enzyme
MPDQVRFVYSGIRVRNLPRSLRFYRAIGFRVLKRGEFSHGGKWVHLVFPGSTHRLELNFYAKGNPFYEPFRPGTEFDHFGFYVSNPIRWLRKAIRAGGKPAVGYVDGPFQLLYVKDPDGVWLGVCGPAWPGALPSPASILRGKRPPQSSPSGRVARSHAANRGRRSGRN